MRQALRQLDTWVLLSAGLLTLHMIQGRSRSPPSHTAPLDTLLFITLTDSWSVPFPLHRGGLTGLNLPLIPHPTPSQRVQRPTSWGGGRGHTYLAGAPPSVFIHLWREGWHSVNQSSFSPELSPARMPKPSGGRWRSLVWVGCIQVNRTMACLPASFPQSRE